MWNWGGQHSSFFLRAGAHSGSWCLCACVCKSLWHFVSVGVVCAWRFVLWSRHHISAPSRLAMGMRLKWFPWIGMRSRCMRIVSMSLPGWGLRSLLTNAAVESKFILTLTWCASKHKRRPQKCTCVARHHPLASSRPAHQAKVVVYHPAEVYVPDIFLSAEPHHVHMSTNL